MWAEVSRSVFRLDSDTSTATAWLIDKDTLVTDAHCVMGQRHFSVVGQDGKRYPIGEMWIDSDHDLAILKTAPGTPLLDKCLKLGDSTELKVGDQVCSFGYKGPFGSLKPLQRFGGTFIECTRYLDVLKGTAKHFGDEIEVRKLEALDKSPASSSDPRAVRLFRPLIALKNNTGVGTSGGPDVDANGKVVSVISFGGIGPTEGLEFSTPVENVKVLLKNKEGIFGVEHRTGHYEIGLATSLHYALDHPLHATFYGSLSTAGYGGAAKFFYEVNKASGVAGIKTGWKLGALAGAGLLGWQTYSDWQKFQSSTTSLDGWKYGTATAGDSAICLSALSMTSKGYLARAGTIGKVLLAAGLATRLAAEFIPNNYVINNGKAPGR